MDKSYDLKIIKKHYGESFAHLCRNLFPTILDKPGLLSNIIFSKFDASRSLYGEVLKDLEGFRDFIKNCAYGTEQQAFAPNSENLSPKQLLERAGYELYEECKTTEELLSFKKYYAPGEELCSFNEGKLRLKNCRVWFAVKKDVEKLNREDFLNPSRQDEYGTSVISIQVAKADGSISIKNRYNHKVENPDATFGNNLDKIIPGLAIAFEETFNFKMDKRKVSNMTLENYELGPDGKYYFVQARLNNETYCENNTVLGFGRVAKYDSGRYLLLDNYLIDFEEKTIRPHMNFFSGEDSFVKSIGEIETMTQTRNENGHKVVVIKPKNGENVEIIANDSNAIIGYKNPNVTEIGDNFMRANFSLKCLRLPKLKKAGFNFLSENRVIEEVVLENLEEVGECFIEKANARRVVMPKLKNAYSCFMKSNTTLKEASFPSLENIGSEFFRDNISMRRIYLPKAVDIETDFMISNTIMEEISLPNAVWLAPGFLKSNNALKRLYAPKAMVSENIMNRFGNALIENECEHQLWDDELFEYETE